MFIYFYIAWKKLLAREAISWKPIAKLLAGIYLVVLVMVMATAGMAVAGTLADVKAKPRTCVRHITFLMSSPSLRPQPRDPV